MWLHILNDRQNTEIYNSLKKWNRELHGPFFFSSVPSRFLQYIDKFVISVILLYVAPRDVLLTFKGGGTVLTDSAQLINVKAVAELAKEYGFRIRVTGSADSATGSAEKNAAVAQSRAKYIADYLVSQGMSEDCIEQSSVGGVNELCPASANRNCKIELFL